MEILSTFRITVHWISTKILGSFLQSSLHLILKLLALFSKHLSLLVRYFGHLFQIIKDRVGKVKCILTHEFYWKSIYSDYNIFHSFFCVSLTSLLNLQDQVLLIFLRIFNLVKIVYKFRVFLLYLVVLILQHLGKLIRKILVFKCILDYRLKLFIEKKHLATLLRHNCNGWLSFVYYFEQGF